MLQNRAFQQVTPSILHCLMLLAIVSLTSCVVTDTAAALNPWSAINGASIAVVNDTEALSDVLPNSLQLTVPGGITGPVGVQNTGFFGMFNWSMACEEMKSRP